MKLLAIDTATTACSVCLAIDGQVVASQLTLKPRQQATLLLPMIKAVLAEAHVELADLDMIALSIGPGSFVGLRIGVGVVQGLAFAHDIPIVPVSTLALLAQGAYQYYQKENILVAVDAHMQEIYWGVYQVKNGTVIAKQPDSLVKPDELVSLVKDNWLAVGDGWLTYEKQLQPMFHPIQIDALLCPDAINLVTLAEPLISAGKLVSAAELQPVYLRGTSAWS